MPPSISVVIPTRNRAQYIMQTLQSVFSQTFKDYETIVIDDGSTDSTQDLLKPLIANSNIHYFFQRPEGVSAARNRGIAEANGSLIAFLDSDDLFLPTKLEKQFAVFSKEPDLGFVHCWFEKFDERGNDLGVRDTSRFTGNIYPQILLEWSVLMAMPCMLVRTDILREVGGFDVQMTWAEDLDLWRRISRKYRVGVVRETLVKVRVHAASTSFDRKLGSHGFTRYLEKAFAEDPELPRIFRRRAEAKMYTKLAQNLLGEGKQEEMTQTRQQCWRAFKKWPLQLDALITWIFTFVPYSLRHFLVTRLRKLRYRAEDNELL